MGFPPHERLVSIDVLRGAVMVIMALDHTRDFFSNAGVAPTDLTKTWPALFMTRWITHFCAPVFIFLAGASAYLSSLKNQDKNRQAAFLLKRGAWIVFLGISFESLIWTFTPDLSVISGAVLWAIGWSMICLAALTFLPLNIITAIGLVMIAVHNSFDAVRSQDLGIFGPLWSILHTGDTVRITEHLSLEPAYPLIPWIGVMAAGYGFGRVLVLERVYQRRVCVGIGALMVVLFFVLRYTNAYGDSTPWSRQDNVVYTLLSFLNCKKYPPSLLYLLMTLGPAVALLPWLDWKANRLSKFLLTFGRVPMFFYLLHLSVLLLAAAAQVWARDGFDTTPLSDLWSTATLARYGYALPTVYLLWVVLLIVLYPLCRWFGAIKTRRHSRTWVKFL